MKARRITAAERIAFITGFDFAEMADNRYQPSRYRVAVYTLGDEYMCCPSSGQKPPADFTWHPFRESMGRMVYSTRPQWQRAFPDFDWPEDCEAMLAAGFEDVSWKNDAMPRFIRGTDSVFIDYMDASLSEFGGGNRFAWTRLDNDGEMTDEYREFATRDALFSFLNNGSK